MLRFVGRRRSKCTACKHLIRVPTIRPLLEDDWFIRKIEEARWNVFMDEATEGNDKVN